MPNALITGASRGLGRALARELAERGWTLVLDARGGSDLASVVNELSGRASVTALLGDVTDPTHIGRLAAEVADLGSLDLLVNNASTLGASPLPRLADADIRDFERTLMTNVKAPLDIFQRVLPYLPAEAMVINITSDASVEAYPHWGMYGASKAALDHVTATIAVEHPDLRVYAFDPGDMRTRMHQQAFPGEDISDRPEPETVIPAILHLLDDRPPSGRLRAADLVASP